MSVIEAQALYKVLLATGQKHFKQAADTPFATGLVANKLGPFADNDYCEAILQGTHVDIEALANITGVQDLIQGMCYPDPSHPTMMISSMITTNSFADMVKHSCEHTSSSPLGQHYGHYCTLLHDSDLLGHITALANFCFKWGKSLRRWEKVTHTLILKEPGD
jgi:hypothetical protein